MLNGSLATVVAFIASLVFELVFEWAVYKASESAARQSVDTHYFRRPVLIRFISGLFVALCVASLVLLIEQFASSWSPRTALDAFFLVPLALAFIFVSLHFGWLYRIDTTAESITIGSLLHSKTVLWRDVVEARVPKNTAAAIELTLKQKTVKIWGPLIGFYQLSELVRARSPGILQKW